MNIISLVYLEIDYIEQIPAEQSELENFYLKNDWEKSKNLQTACALVYFWSF